MDYAEDQLLKIYKDIIISLILFYFTWMVFRYVMASAFFVYYVRQFQVVSFSTIFTQKWFLYIGDTLAKLIAFIFVFMFCQKKKTFTIFLPKIQNFNFSIFFAFIALYFSIFYLFYLFMCIADSVLHQETILFYSHFLSALPLLPENILQFIFFFLSVVVVTPIIEEYLFREFLLNKLFILVGNGLAVVIASLLFALLHFTNHFIFIFELFLFSCLLSCLYLYTKNLFYTICLHAFHNFFVFVLWLKIGKLHVFQYLYPYLDSSRWYWMLVIAVLALIWISFTIQFLKKQVSKESQ